MSITIQNQLDSRLAVRVLQVWKDIAAIGLPSCSQIDPKDFGADWPNCAVIALNPTVPKSRFSYVGSELKNFISVPFKRKTFAKLHEETLLKLLNPQILEVVAEKAPLKFAGSARHNDKDILYRTVLMPLSNNGKQIDGILVGMSYRKVSVQEELLGAGRSVGYRHAADYRRPVNAIAATAWG